MGNVDNVDKKVDGFLLETCNCRKNKEFNIFLLQLLSNYVNCVMHKKIHMLRGMNMWKTWWIVWITLLTKDTFADFIHISGTHSYQHISVDTIF